MDEEKFPELIRQLYATVAELEAMFGRPFTPDGHMVGSIAECYAHHYYGIDLTKCSTRGHDGVINDCQVEVKATQGKQVALRSGPERLLVFQLHRDGTLSEIYNGPGAPIWKLVEHKPRPSNGQYSVSLSALRRAMDHVLPEDRLPRVR